VFLVPIGSETNALPYQTIRNAQKQLALENPAWIYYCPERFDLQRADTIHMTDASAAICADRTTRKMLSVLGYTVPGPVDGSVISAASRVGAIVTATLTHPVGITDFTPASAIQGFRFFNAVNAEVSIISADHTDATTITVTLASAPSGVDGTLYYGYQSLNEITDLTKLVHGNDSNTLPLKSVQASLPYTG
jgi:hypothetical protein